MNADKDYFIQSSRLRSARSKKRSQKEDVDKTLIRLYREERALSKKIWDLGYEELKPPIQRGWKRLFVLRDDVARTKEAKFFAAILEKINTVQFSSRKDFKVRRRKFGKKFYADKSQELEKFCAYSFEKKKFSEKEKVYFYQTLMHVRNSKKPVLVYVFTEPWRFVLRIQPNMITKVKKKDLDLERRQAEISRYIDDRFLRNRLWKLLDGSVQWRLRYDYQGDLPKYKHMEKVKKLYRLLEDHWPDQTMKQDVDPRIDRGFCFLYAEPNFFYAWFI